MGGVASGNNKWAARVNLTLVRLDIDWTARLYRIYTNARCDLSTNWILETG